MPLGITNTTIINISSILDISNVTDPINFFRNVNDVIYQGYLYFILIMLLFFILFYVLVKTTDQPLNSIMYSAAACSVIGFVLRAAGLFSANQVWIFPIITVITLLIIWFTKD